jgi:hypothetical protein
MTGLCLHHLCSLGLSQVSTLTTRQSVATRQPGRRIYENKPAPELTLPRLQGLTDTFLILIPKTT